MPWTSQNVVVTGLGPVSPIGIGRQAFWQSLWTGKGAVGMRELQVDAARRETLPVVSMPPASSVPGLAPHMEFLASQECPGNRDLGYSMLAMELALADAKLNFDRERNRVGLVQVFEAPGAERTVTRLFEMMSAVPPPGSPPMGPPPVYDFLAPAFYGMQPFLHVHLAGKAFSLRGFCTSVHNACSSAAFAIETAAQQIRSGNAEAMIVAGGEAFETGVRLEWFRRLELYAREPLMRPFDEEPGGFFVGEGGAAIVMESAESARRRGAKVYAEYAGGAWAHQGWKQTIPDIRAGRLRGVIEDALKASNVKPKEIDLIVPHGAGTSLSDGYESGCVKQALSGEAEQAVATALKPYVGHLLAACGLMETLAALLALDHQAVPATLNTRAGRSTFPVPLATSPIERRLNVALKLFTGFTGHDAAAVFRRI